MSSPQESPTTLYLVMYLHWEYNDEFYDLEDDRPVRAYVSRADAEAARADIERQARSNWTGENLAMVFRSAALTTTPPDIFLARLSEERLPLPPITFDPVGFMEGWEGADLYDQDWWDMLWSTLPENRVWELFDGLQFSEVVEIEVE